MHAVVVAGAARNSSARLEQGQASLWLAGRRIGVIDVGSNAIRLLGVELVNDRSWRVLVQERAMTRLVHGVGQTGELCEDSMRESAKAIARFKQMAHEHGVTELRAFATAAVRDARNRAEFLGRVQERAGVQLEIVSAADEGRLTHRSVARVYDLSRGPVAVIDIGGGSMEVVFSRDGVVTWYTSMPLGAVRVTEQFGGPAVCAGKAFRKMRRYIEREILTHVPAVDEAWSIVVGCGGVFTTILTIASARRGQEVDRNSPELLKLAPVNRAELRAILDDLRAMSPDERARVPGLPRDRADIAVAGITAVERLITHLRAPSVHVHPGGFREGLLLRMIDDLSMGG